MKNEAPTRPAQSQEWREFVFDNAGNSTVHWMMYAQSLLDSAAAIRKNVHVFRRKLFRRRPDPDLAYFDSQADVFLLLQGLAIECLLKTKYVSDGGVLAKNGRFIGIKGAGSHNLRQIVDQCQRRFREKQQEWKDRKHRFPSDSDFEHIYSEKKQLVFSDRQLFLLDQLSQYIMWAGRYPIPKSVEIYKPKNEKSELLRNVSVKDFQEIDRIIKIIKLTMTAGDWKQLKNGKWVYIFPEDK
jgi:hypothetical protein